MLSLIRAIQRHVAVFAVGLATVRGQGARGVIAAAREFFEAGFDVITLKR